MSSSDLIFIFCGGILHNIQLTQQKLSAARKNLPGATGAGEWPQDQRLHRGRRLGCRRYKEVPILEYFFYFLTRKAPSAGARVRRRARVTEILTSSCSSSIRMMIINKQL